MDLDYKKREYLDFLENCFKNPVVLIEISSLCNFKCEYCLSRLKTRKKCFMQPDLFEHIVAQVPEITSLPLRLHIDGEPTLHPHFFDYAKLLNRRNIPFGLATNGSLLTPQFLDLKMEIILSISTNETEFRLRTKSLSYEKYLSNIVNYFKAWMHSQSEQTIHVQIPIDLNCKDETYTAQKRNFVQNFISEMKAAQKSGNMYCENAGCDTQLIKANGSIMRFYYWGISKTPNYTEPTPSDRSVTRGFCSMPWHEIGVLADGRVTFCCSDLTGGTAFTEEKDIFKRPLLELWTHKKITDVRRKFLQRKISLDVCKRCLAAVPNNEFYSDDHPLGSLFPNKDEALFPVNSIGRSRKKKSEFFIRKLLIGKNAVQTEAKNHNYNGWWFNPDEWGGGVSVEVRKKALSMAIFTYDEQSGDPVCLYSEGKMIDRFRYKGKLLRQVVDVKKDGNKQIDLPFVGSVELLLKQGEISLLWTWQGRRGTKSLVRFMEYVSPGCKDPRDIHGWWHNPAQGARLFIEAQGGTMVVALCHHDDLGYSRWRYCFERFQVSEATFYGLVKEFHYGQSLGSSYREPFFKELGTMRIQFLENGRASLFYNDSCFNLERMKIKG